MTTIQWQPVNNTCFQRARDWTTPSDVPSPFASRRSCWARDRTLLAPSPPRTSIRMRSDVRWERSGDFRSQTCKHLSHRRAMAQVYIVTVDITVVSLSYAGFSTICIPYPIVFPLLSSTHTFLLPLPPINFSLSFYFHFLSSSFFTTPQVSLSPYVLWLRTTRRRLPETIAL